MLCIFPLFSSFIVPQTVCIFCKTNRFNMRHFSILFLGLGCFVPGLLADRSSNAHNTPTVCNTEPETTQTSPPSRRHLRHMARRQVESSDTSIMERGVYRRSGVVSYDSNCDSAPPAKSTYGPKTGFDSMKSVLQQAYTDASTLASQAANVDKNSPAYVACFTSKDQEVTDTDLVLRITLAATRPTCSTRTLRI